MYEESRKKSFLLKDVSTIHSTLSQPSRTLSIWHPLFLKEFSSSPHAPLHLVWDFFFISFRDPFKQIQAVKKDHNQKPSSDAHLKFKLKIIVSHYICYGFGKIYL